MIQQLLCENPTFPSAAAFNEEAVRKVALAVRRKAIKIYGGDLAGTCAICSFAIARKLKQIGFMPCIVEGWFTSSVTLGSHVWVEISGKIIDITHSQFIESKLPILIVNESSRRFIPIKKHFDLDKLLKSSWIGKEEKAIKQLL